MRVLLLDTAFAAAPIYRFLVEAGHEVWAMGNRAADLVARKAGPNWIEQDYSDVAAVEAHVARLGIERVVPGCTDVSIDTCCRLSVGVDLRDGAEVTDTLRDKGQFRAVCARLDLPAPRVVDVATFPRAGRHICKPVDAFSGRGITVFDGMDTAALEGALAFARAASPTGTAIVETFAEGDLYSCSAFVEAKRLTEAFFVIEGSSVNPYAVDTSYVVHDMPPACVRAIREALERLSAFLDLRDGLLHTQFILADGLPVIIEATRRCPGDLYPLLIEYSTGFRHAAKYASYFLGEPLDARHGERRHILRHTVTADDDGCFEGLVFRGSERVAGYFPLVPMGERLRARQGNRAGLLFCEEPGHDELLAAYDRFLARRAYRVDDARLPASGAAASA